MAGRRPDPSPTSLARANRQRMAMEEGARAIAEVERSSAAVRKNMERLRGLREAKEAADAAHALANPPPPAVAKTKKRVKPAVG